MKYDSFKEYLQLNYLGVINKALEEQIQENELNDFESYIVNNIKVTGVKFTKSRKDKVEFIVSLVTSYDLIDINKDIIVHNRELLQKFKHKVAQQYIYQNILKIHKIHHYIQKF